MKAAYWTAIGAMLIPVGIIILIEKPDWSNMGTGIMIVGFISFIVGWCYTIREEHRNAEKDKEEKKQRVIEDEWKKKQEKARVSSHYLDTLIQYEMLRALGINPQRVSRRYRRWLADRSYQEQLRKYEEEAENDDSV